jgi:sec-independent protein translocase protein TatA
MAPGPTQILIIALIILLLFGATRLSEIGKGLGEGIRNFKKGIQDEPDDKVSASGDASGAKKRLPSRKNATPEDTDDQEEERETSGRA